MKILLFNPKATTHNCRIPNSILSIAASVDGMRDYVIVDGNRELDPHSTIDRYLATGEFGYFCPTVMPGPQLRQAIPFSKKIREKYPEMVIIWGGYFASNQSKVVLESGFVDYVIQGPGDVAFPLLIQHLENGSDYSHIPNLSYVVDDGEIRTTPRGEIPDQDLLPPLPYSVLDQYYPLSGYLGRTFLGNKTIAYHSSMGCPFTCSFCGIVPIYEGRWRAKSADNVFRDILWLKNHHGGDAVEFHDNNFFVSEKRTVEFSRLMLGQGMQWWGEGRIDTVDKYSDESLRLMRQSGCTMIFFGAETGNDVVLKRMNKGGTQSGEQMKRFASRMRRHSIIPEFSFVLGTPAANPSEAWQQLEFDIAYIKEIKSINPDTEIVIYVYSPVPTVGSDLFEAARRMGFTYPTRLEDWISPEWENFDLRKNPLTPWLTPDMVDRIKDFETVLNGRYPTVSDLKLSALQKAVVRSLSALRYRTNIFAYPFEIRAIQKYWMKYRQPELEGF